MPIFEYQCETCETKKDSIRSYHDRELSSTCPQCGGRLKFIDKIHPTSFSLKGNGWYETDFKNK